MVIVILAGYMSETDADSRDLSIVPRKYRRKARDLHEFYNRRNTLLDMSEIKTLRYFTHKGEPIYDYYEALRLLGMEISLPVLTLTEK